jgi:hypothetical protein
LTTIFFYANIQARNNELLCKKDNHYPIWDQTVNNKGGCNPSYNYFCPSGYSGDPCDKCLVGCGPVAMGLIMYKWEWPNIYRNYYDWDIMDGILKDGDNLYIPRLLRDCGIAANTHYESFLNIHTYLGIPITGSWTTNGDLKEGLSSMHYNCRLYSKDDWDYGSAWSDLLQSELKCKRPIIVYGEHSDFTDSHYYVIDGYNNGKWHINAGNGKYLKDVNLNDYTFHNKRKFYVGISPQYPAMPEIRSMVNTNGKYTELDAKYCIKTSPSNPVTLDSGKVLVLIAGDSIVLKSGFKVMPGSSVKIKINPEYKKNSDITYRLLYKTLNRICHISANNQVKFVVNNANSWECEISDRNGKRIWRNAGTVDGDTINVWDGSSDKGIINLETYWIVLTLKNNLGQIIDSKPIPIAINNVYCPISYKCLNTYFSPKCKDGINDYIGYITNAETFSCSVYDRNGKEIKSFSGNIINDTAKIIDDRICSKLRGGTDYWYTVSFFTSEGGGTSTKNHFLYNSASCGKTSTLKLIEKNKFTEEELDQTFSPSKELSVEINPNPNNGYFNIHVNGDGINSIWVENSITGEIVYSSFKITNSDIKISIHNAGIYVVKISNGEKIVAKKVIIK